MLGRGPQQGLYRPRGLGFEFGVEFRVVTSQKLQQSTDQRAARRPGGGAPSASLLCSQDPSDGWDCLSAYYASFRVPKAVVRFAQGSILRNLGPQSTCTTLVLGPFATKVLGQLDELLHKFQGPKSSTEVCAKLGQAVSILVLALLDKRMDSAVQVVFNSQPWTLNPQAQTQSRQPQTPNHKPSTQNPKP